MPRDGLPGALPHVDAKSWRSGRWQFPNAFLLPKGCETTMRNFIHKQRLVLKISNKHAQTFEHEGRNETLQFHMALRLFSQPFCTRRLVALREASSYQLGLYPVHWLEAESAPWTHWSTCPRQKQNLPEKNKYKTQSLLVFSRCPQMSLCDHNKLSDWPKTFLGAMDVDWGAASEQGDEALILFWATWTGFLP